MCGICGVVNFNNRDVEDSTINKMIKEIKHRGPDDQGIYTDNEIGLGFVRLSIIDLTTAGHQPMKSEDDNFVIVFNGEIFNYIEIRKELENLGYEFNTKTDTEVLLKSYQEWGENCLNKLNGMWAFAIYDKIQNKLFLSRDRYGIKPLYYYKNEQHFYFASEIKALLPVVNNLKPNNQAIYDYLVYNRVDHTEDTFFYPIKKLLHGQKINIKNNQIQISKWYDLKSNIKDPFQSAEDYLETFKDSISLRLRSDVPIGVCLSGGLDSSAITSTLLSEFNQSDLNTFSAVYEKGQLGDESDFIAIYENSLKNMHYTSPTGDSLYKDLNEFILAHTEPIPTTSPYAQYKVMELAQKYAVVTLDGQGADEQLGGYHYFFGLYYKGLLKKGKIDKLFKENYKYFQIHQSSFALKSFLYFLLPNHLKNKARIDNLGYLNSNFAKQFSKTNAVSGNLYASNSLSEALIDHFEYKLEHLLKWEDLNSMHFSLESRVPFLDYRLVESTISLPEHLIINNGETKYILRQAMKGILPEKIRKRQDKVGFGTPQDEWFRQDNFKKLILGILNSQSFKDRGIINHKLALEQYTMHLNGQKNISKEIWKWINLEIWFREFFDDKLIIN